MMKHTKKIASTFVLMLSLITFTACTNNDNDTEVVTEPEVITETEPTYTSSEVHSETETEDATERSVLFEEHRQWAIERIDFLEEELERDSVMTVRLMLGGLSRGISESLGNLLDWEIRLIMTELGLQVDNLLEALEGAQPLIDSGAYEDEYVLNMFGDILRPRLVEMREELEDLE